MYIHHQWWTQINIFLFHEHITGSVFLEAEETEAEETKMINLTVNLEMIYVDKIIRLAVSPYMI